MKRLYAVLAAAVAALMMASLATPAIGEDDGDIADRWMAGKRSVVVGHKQPGSTSNVECSVTKTAANLRLDCDDPFPNNEPDIEVDPANALHMVASSNDYGTCCDQFYTTFDGGQHWTTGNMSNEGPTRIGSDPVTVFDVKHGTVIHPSLNFKSGGGNAGACDGDLVVSLSHDGGITWENPILVADGSGCDNSKTQLFHDKEWIVTDNNPASPYYGQSYLTWTGFVSHNGVVASSAIFESQSSDGGNTWSAPREISGSNGAICTFQENGPQGECDENQFSVPTVTPNGTVYVAFQNDQNQALWEPGELFDDQYLVVRSTNGGATWSAPQFVVGLEDGTRDYPLNVNDRQTLNGYQVRVNSAGNLTAAPDGTLYLVFADNRAGAHDRDHPVTNTNVYMMTSTDGTTWSGPTPVDTSASDQWFPWVEVNPTNGIVGVLYNSRVAGSTWLYNAKLAQGAPGAWGYTTVSTAASHPRNSIYFAAHAPNCDRCATFHGDYIGIDYGSDGKANLVWTDMRDYQTAAHSPTGIAGYEQFIYFARQ